MKLLPMFSSVTVFQFALNQTLKTPGTVARLSASFGLAAAAGALVGWAGAAGAAGLLSAGLAGSAAGLLGAGLAGCPHAASKKAAVSGPARPRNCLRDQGDTRRGASIDEPPLSLSARVRIRASCSTSPIYDDHGTHPPATSGVARDRRATICC
jgi:hypothetical protein